MLVQNSAEINGPVDQVYALAKGIYSSPEFMPDVRSIRVVRRSEDGSHIVSEWEVMVREFRTLVRWTAEDIWDDASKTCRFSIVNSDYYTYKGQWSFIDIGGSTGFNSEVEIECDLPQVAGHVRGFVAKKMKGNVDNMLAAIRSKVEAGA